jgi:hypothetical protein
MKYASILGSAIISLSIILAATAFGESCFPLAVGNEWRYVYYNDDHYQYTVLNKIKAVQTMQDGNQAYALYTYTPIIHESVVYYCDSGESIYVYQTETDKPSLFLQLPLELNKTWNSGDPFSSVSYQVVGQEEVTVPAGTFQTWKVEVNDVVFHRFIYFTEGVGQVQVVYDNGSRYELKEYKVAGGE